MNDEAIAFQEPVRHLHLIDADVRYLHRNNLRFRCETNCLKFDLFSAEKPWLEILQRQHKAITSKRPASLHVDFLRPIFQVVLLTFLRRGRLCFEVHREMAHELPTFKLAPRPLFLNELGLLPEDCFLLGTISALKSVGDRDVQAPVIDPLCELAVSQFFSIGIQQCWKTVRGRFKFGHFYGRCGQWRKERHHEQYWHAFFLYLHRLIQSGFLLPDSLAGKWPRRCSSPTDYVRTGFAVRHWAPTRGSARLLSKSNNACR